MTQVDHLSEHLLCTFETGLACLYRLRQTREGVIPEVVAGQVRAGGGSSGGANRIVRVENGKEVVMVVQGAGWGVIEIKKYSHLSRQLEILCKLDYSEQFSHLPPSTCTSLPFTFQLHPSRAYLLVHAPSPPLGPTTTNPSLDLYSISPVTALLIPSGSLVFPSTVSLPRFTCDAPTTGLYLLTQEQALSMDQEDSLGLYQLASGVRVRKAIGMEARVMQVTWDCRYVVAAGEGGVAMCRIDEEVADEMGYVQERVIEGLGGRYEIAWAPRQRVVDEKLQR